MDHLFTRTTDRATPGGVADGSDAFDFLHGSWNVRHRRLRERLVGDTRWDAFEGTSACRPVIGGLGNVDDNLIGLPAGAYRAVTLRLFDRATGLWSIWWADGRTMRLDPPLQGRFTDGVGLFHGDDVLDGRPIRVRFVWSRTGADVARWEQAFSADAGRSWETNWIMDFVRADRCDARACRDPEVTS